MARRGAAGGRTVPARAGPPGRRLPDAPDSIVCALCNRPFRAISCAHLRFVHGWEGEHPIRAYKSRFGLRLATCPDSLRRLRRSLRRTDERTGRAWPRRRVLDVLRRRHAARKSLAASRLPGKLFNAARRRFGSLGAALRRAGIDPNAHRLQLGEHDAGLLATLRRLARDGGSLASSRLPPRLRDALARHFGSHDEALRRAGIDPNEHRLCRRWTKGEIVACVREALRAGESLVFQEFVRRHTTEANAAIRIFRSWGRALRAAGLDPKEHFAPTKWSIEIARARVLARHAAGKPLFAKCFPAGLVLHVRRRFGTWPKFVVSLGLAPARADLQLDWTARRVLEWIRDRRRRGLPLSTRAVIAAGGSATLHQARKFFGSYRAALKVAGLDPATVFLTRSWTRAAVLAAIRARLASGKSMVRGTVYSEASGLVGAAARFFGYSWQKAMRAAGIDPRLHDGHGVASARRGAAGGEA